VLKIKITNNKTFEIKLDKLHTKNKTVVNYITFNQYNIALYFSMRKKKKFAEP